MDDDLELPALLPLIEERSLVLRAVAASAADLDVPVPGCPGWTLLDLVEHLGQGQRRWAAVVAAGPADAPPAGAAPQDAPQAPRERAALLAWAAESTELLVAALREAGPDRGCWTWWDGSESPSTSGAVARHQLQEVAVHTHDAQASVGAGQPLPERVALDGVDEFLRTCCAGPHRWPHAPADVDYRATEGRSWRLSLSPDGVRVTRLPAPGAVPTTAAGEHLEAAAASLTGTAGELVLALYGRVPVASLQVAGDARVFDQLLAWDPDA